LHIFLGKRVENRVLIHAVVYIMGIYEEDSIGFGIFPTWEA
jgi:hypothetical protein